MVVDYPLALGALIVPLVTGVSLRLRLFNRVFFGFILFMVVVGGLLVVFAYAAALSPEVSFSVKPFNYPIMRVLFISLGWWGSVRSYPLEFPEVSRQRGFQLFGVPGFTLNWGLCRIYLCGLLFIIIVSVAGRCGKLGRSGAMVVGKREGG